MGLFKKNINEDSVKFKEGLTKTRSNFLEKLESLITGKKNFDEEFYDELEEILIGADIGVATVLTLTDQLRESVKNNKIDDPVKLKPMLAEAIFNILDKRDNINLNILPGRLNIILFVGVNGVGKTTSIGKLAYKLKEEGKKVILAAGDTFRAGAIEQLEIWGERIGVNVIKHQAGADPAAVIYDAIQSAKAKGVDVLICDTAGRLHNKVNLMQELNKIFRTIQKEVSDAPHEVLLTLDATTGQNAMQQAKLFSQSANVTGIVLTKLDGTAKGGIVVSISDELEIPVKLITLGEKVNDLQEFDSKKFINAIFEEIISL